MKSCYKAGLIRVITLPDAEAAGIHGRLIMEMFPNMTVETKCIPDQPDGLHSVESKTRLYLRSSRWHSLLRI